IPHGAIFRSHLPSPVGVEILGTRGIRIHVLPGSERLDAPVSGSAPLIELILVGDRHAIDLDRVCASQLDGLAALDHLRHAPAAYFQTAAVYCYQGGVPVRVSVNTVRPGAEKRQRAIR